jgi:hypothetical protein
LEDTKEDPLKIRLVALCIGIVGLVGVGATPAAAAQAPDTCPILYPFCG